MAGVELAVVERRVDVRVNTKQPAALDESHSVLMSLRTVRMMMNQLIPFTLNTAPRLPRILQLRLASTNCQN